MNASALEQGLTATARTATAEPGSFDRYVEELTHSWARIITLLGVTLIPVFLLLDAFTMPEALRAKFAVYRLVTTLIVLGQYFLLRRTQPSRLSFFHGYFFTLVVGGMIVRMTSDLGGFDSSYYDGLNLVMVAVNMLLPWRATHSALNGLLLIALYVGANAILGLPFAPATLINNLYFLSATLVIAVAISFTRHRLIAKEFQLRSELVAANHDLDHSRLALKDARDALWGEMEVAKHIQTALLPQGRLMGGFQVEVFMQPAAEVGGDYYDLIESAHGEQWMAIGDVSGHGVESGLVMMMTQTSLLSMVTDLPQRSPSEVFERVNRVLCENIGRLGTGRYMTLNLVRFEGDRLRVAGKHQDILVWRKEQDAVETVENEGVWIGIVPDTRGVVSDLELELAPGDVALFFTDGITEAVGQGNEMFGQDRLTEVFRHAAKLPLDQAKQALVGAVNRFWTRQEDDITLVLVRRS